MFVTSHRAGNPDNLVVRMKNGIGSSKYKPVDYHQLRAETEAKKLASASIQLKIKKTQHASKISKDQMLVKQQSQVWWKEYERLNESRNKVEKQLKEFLEEGGLTSQFFSEMNDLELRLSEDRDRYKECTVHPIWQLRDDLKHRIGELRYHSLHQTQMESDFHPDGIIQQIESVKEQQKTLITNLDQEQHILEEALKDYEATELSSAEGSNEVPAVLQDLQCPYPDLKSSVLSEYQSLAERYLSNIHELEIKVKDIDRDCTWSDEHHWIFGSIISQYPRDLPNRRALYLDMMSRQLPDKSRQELVNHEKIWDLHHFTKVQKSALTENWARCRKDFIMKAVMAINEACSAYETERILENDRKKQQEICSELKEKVRHLRAQHEEVARLESAIAARNKEREAQREKQQREKEKLHRADDRARIQKYKAEKQQAWEELQMRDLQRLEQLKEMMAEQAQRDRERALYRQQVLEQRLLERKELARLEQKEEEERQRRLDALRQQVAVIAEFDPVRMMSDTKSFKAKMGIGIEQEVVLQKPLFQLCTYNEQQIISDQRVRVEMALREAGLHKTEYAKEILPKILPPKPPRKDMKSTVFAK
ncbi:coiled-coil domain-containing protein 148 [Spea bombifrons]|uniref:coiled-coil domain-containing protein 148 n=1 Tax=Spea bombifrons TaxID=233779 RepID=UPI00234BA7A2|nr:coiled-coil domain-containing protein 148 [Spea bombifrons]